MKTVPQIWTIGHSTRALETFFELLQSCNIQVLVDVRSLPGSRKFPQFNQEELRDSLKAIHINYHYCKQLGGRRKPCANSLNTAWHNPSFRAYADYMETSEFAEGLAELKTIAESQNTAVMCAEAVWWRCHRSMISDALKTENWQVWHIMDVGKTTLHPFTQPAKIVDGQLTYH